MLEFNKMVKTENTINRIQVKGGPAAAPLPGLPRRRPER